MTDPPPPHLSCTPYWQQIILAASEAFGGQIASAFSHSSASASFSALGRALEAFVRNFPTTSGADSAELLQFLTSFREILILKLAGHSEVILAVFNKTEGQLRAIWADAVQERVDADTLISNVLKFFLPKRLRQKVILDVVYRVQKQDETA